MAKNTAARGQLVPQPEPHEAHRREVRRHHLAAQFAVAGLARADGARWVGLVGARRRRLVSEGAVEGAVRRHLLQHRLPPLKPRRRHPVREPLVHRRRRGRDQVTLYRRGLVIA